MFLFRSNNPGPVRRVNAISSITLPDQDTRRARHLRQCERLAELGMALAERTASQALTEPAPQPDAEFGPSPSALAFTRLARCVRASITLEARLANGTLPPFPNHTLPEDQTTDADQEKLRTRLIFLRGCELRQALRQTLETTQTAAAWKKKSSQSSTRSRSKIPQPPSAKSTSKAARSSASSQTSPV